MAVMKHVFGKIGFTDPIIEKLAPFPHRILQKRTDYLPYEDIPAAMIMKIAPLIPRANLAERQNNGPSISSMVKFAARCLAAKFEGYVITKERDDERVTLDAVSIPPECESMAKRSVFRSALSHPDFDENNYRGNYRHVWWD